MADETPHPEPEPTPSPPPASPPDPAPAPVPGPPPAPPPAPSSTPPGYPARGSETPPPPPPPPPPPAGYGAPGYGAPGYGIEAPRTEGSAIGAFVVALVGLFVCGIVTGIVALVMANNANRKIEESFGQLTGKGFVTAARVIAIVSIGLSVLGIVFVITA